MRDEELADAGFKPTPSDERMRARLLDGVTIEYCDLTPGQIFQALRPDGAIVSPLCPDDEDPQLYAMCIAHPVPSIDQGHGWAVEVVVGSLDEMRTKRMH